MKLSPTCELNENPFTYTEEDIIAAVPGFTSIDGNDHEDVNPNLSELFSEFVLRCVRGAGVGVK